MINKQNFTECDVPVLYKLMAIKQPEDDISLQFWDNIVEFYEQEFPVSQKTHSLQSEENSSQDASTKTKKIQLLFAKGKEGYLMIWKFQNGCLMFQKSIKIPYAANKEITTIKAFTVKSPGAKQLPSNLNESVSMLILGYFDGIAEIFVIKMDESTITLSKCLSINNTTQEPITNVVIYNHTNLLICRSHYIYLYPHLIEDLYKKVISKSKAQLNCTETLLKIKELNNSTKISMFLSESFLHIYNEIEGLFSFTVPEMESSGSIIDSVKILAETPEGDLVLGSADDSVKIIYSESNQIERISGLKSFVSTISIKEFTEQKIIELWMGDMYGEIHYLAKTKKSIVSKSLKESFHHKSPQKGNQMVLYEKQFNRGVEITENGIKKILLATNLLVIVDTQMNILVYDIVRNLNTLTGRSTT